jgi:hypothetical protein
MGAGKLGNNDVTQGPASCTNVPPNQKVSKAEKPNHLNKHYIALCPSKPLTS